MCVPLPHEQDTNSADTAYGIACLTILELCIVRPRVARGLIPAYPRLAKVRKASEGKPLHSTFSPRNAQLMDEGILNRRLKALEDNQRQINQRVEFVTSFLDVSQYNLTLWCVILSVAVIALAVAIAALWRHWI